MPGGAGGSGQAGLANAALSLCPQEKLALKKKRRKEREALGDKVRAPAAGAGVAARPLLSRERGTTGRGEGPAALPRAGAPQLRQPKGLSADFREAQQRIH